MTKGLLKALLLMSAFIIGGPVYSASLDSAPGEVTVKFELEDQSGELFTEKNLRGKYVLLAFGFTHCRHICPMMAANMGLALKISGLDAMGVFISVDTERDTPEIAHVYASGFSDRMIGLGGSFEQIRAAATNFGISYVVTKSHKAYIVEHTSDIFLIGPDGQLIEVFALNAPPEEIAAAMKQ